MKYRWIGKPWSTLAQWTVIPRKFDQAFLQSVEAHNEAGQQESLRTKFSMKNET